MNYLAAASTLVAALQAAGALAHDIPIVIDLVRGAVTAVERSGRSGDDKLTSVLQSAELVLVELPKLEAGVEPLLAEVAVFVKALVATYNQARVFTHAIGRV